MITYDPLWRYLNSTDPDTGRRRKLADLYDDPQDPAKHPATGISRATVSRMRKNQSISLETLNTICEYLGLQPGQVLEYLPGPQPVYIRPEKRKSRTDKTEK